MPGDPTWADLVARFAAHLEDDLGRSPHTVRAYRDDMNGFAAWFRSTRDEDPRPAGLIRRDTADWEAHLRARDGRKGKARIKTVQRKMTALRQFFAWLAKHDLGVRFDPPRVPRKSTASTPRWLTRAEERALIVAAEAAQSARDLAILYLGLHGGLRVSECSGLDWEDITISDRKGVMTIRGKGDVVREVQLSLTLKKALLDWRAGCGFPRGPVCLGQRGRLKPRMCQYVVERFARAARVGGRAGGIKDFSHHCLRHTCARRMIDGGVPIVDVAAHLGHADVKTTMIYVQSREETMSKAVGVLDQEN